jgi:hypothetical protein
MAKMNTTMKRNFTYILLTLPLLYLIGCSTPEPGPAGPQGPQGPEGPQGAPGESGFVFEYENVSFTAPAYEAFLQFPADFDVLPSDVVLAYLLWDVQEIDGELVDIWRPLPQQLFTENGLLIYNYDFTIRDVRLFLDAGFPLDLLTAIDTDDWIVRVVIVPGNFVDSERVGPVPYEDVESMLGLPNNFIRKTNIKDRRNN